MSANDNLVLRIRAILLGIVIVLIQSIVAPYNNYVVQGPSFSGNHFPTISVFILGILTALNLLFRKIKPGSELNPAELAAIWMMSLVTAGIPSKGLLRNLLPMLVAHTYFATPENQWTELFEKDLHPWLVVKDKKAIMDFFEGSDKLVPWGSWMGPLIFWSVFVLVLYFTIVCICIILRSRWVDQERLSFPLLQLPLEMVTTPFFKNKLMWFGLAIPAFVYAINGLNRHFPFIPSIPLTFNIYSYFTNKPWSALGLWPPARIIILFSIIGIAYLVPTEISLSIWFFYLFYKSQQIAASALAIPLPHTAGQSMGSILVIAFYILWKARRSVKAAILNLIFPKRKEDTQEPLDRKYAFLGIIGGIAVLVMLLVWIEADIHISLIVIILYFLVSIVLTWMIVQGGLLRVQVPFYPSEYLEHPFGIRTIGYKNLTILTIPQHALMRDWWEIPMPNIMHALRMPGLVKTNHRRFLLLIAIALVIGIGASYYSSLTLIYNKGGLNLGYGDVWGCRQPYRKIANFLVNPTGLNREYSGGMLLGSLLTCVMLILRSRFLWWPLHPIGYALGASHSPYTIWSSFLIAWIIKYVVLKAGDIGTYRRYRPFFLGLVFGEYSMAGIWMIVSMITNVSYNFFPW